MKRITIVLVVLAMIAAVSMIAQAQATKNLAGAYNTVVLDGSTNMVKMNEVSSVSISNVATTTVTAITPVTGRDRLIIRVNSNDVTKAAYINLGGTVATDAYGIRIDYNTPLDIELSDDVDAAFVSSGAAPLAIIQTVRE